MGPVSKVVIGAALTGAVAVGSHWRSAAALTDRATLAATLIPYLAMFVAFLLGLLFARLIWRDTRRSGR